MYNFNNDDSYSYNDIKKYCDSMLEQKYPAGVPAAIKERYNVELQAQRDSGGVKDFELFMNLSIEAKRASQLMFLRGLASGSFLVYLVNDFHANPLTPHYYCPECGYYEEIVTDQYGIDIHSRKCPKCGREIYADGMNLLPIHVWGAEMKRPLDYEASVSGDFYSYAKNVIQSAYPNNEIEVYGVPVMVAENSIVLEQGGYVILPAGKTINDYPNLIAHLSDGTKCLAGSISDIEDLDLKRIKLLHLRWLDLVLDMQNKTDIEYEYIGTEKLRDITFNGICRTGVVSEEFVNLAKEASPCTFKMMSDLFAATHNRYANTDEDKDTISDSELSEFIHSDSFVQYPLFTKEDIFEHLVKWGLDDQTAFEYSEFVRKGKLNRIVYENSERLKSMYHDLLEVKIPAELYNTAARVKYLFPRSHVVNYMRVYYLLAYYMKLEPEEYGRYLKTISRGDSY